MDWMDGWMDERNRMERAMGSRGMEGMGQGATGELGHQGTGATGNGEWKVCVMRVDTLCGS